MKLGLIAERVHRHGGMERAAAEVMERIARQYPVVVIARECEVQAEHLTFVPVRPVSRPSVLMNWSFRTLAHLQEKRLDLTLTNAIGASAIEADVITAQFCHAAFHQRQGGVRGGANPVRRWYQNYAERLFTRQEQAAYTSPRLKAVIAVSAGIKRELIQHYGVAAQKIEVIPNAVDHAVFQPAADVAAKKARRCGLGLPEDDFVCLFVGGDWERKGVADAICAIAGLPGVTLVIVGKGSIARFGLVARLAGAEHQVVFAGLSRQTQDYYAAADVFVFPSRYEAFSLVTIEAAAAGLPIIALPINGTEELIEDGLNGFFVDGSPEKIREKIRLLQEDRALRNSLSAAILETSQRYTWDNVARDQCRVFEQAAGK